MPYVERDIAGDRRMMQAQSCKNMAESQVSTRKSASRGFTLIELLIVLAIAALISALVFAGFTSMSNGHRRTSCQANMAQFYTALRQYAADEGSFPAFDPTKNDNPTTNANNGRGIGLWVLYAFPKDSDADKIAPPPTENVPFPRPLERYIRSSKVLHCPADTESTNLTMENPMTGPNEATTVYNPDYLSYQVLDDQAFLPSGGDNRDQFTYVPRRIETRTDIGWKRQLAHYAGPDNDPATNNASLVRRPPTDNTVVLWCPFHRGGTGVKLDNVLFYDGSVQVIPFNDQERAWLRDPKNPS